MHKPSNNAVDVFETQDIPELKGKKKTVNKILESFKFNAIINFFIIFALFGDDFKILALPKASDNYIDAINIFCMILFITEILLTLYVKNDYFNSFFFWLDFLSTLTLVLDLSWISTQFSSSTCFLINIYSL